MHALPLSVLLAFPPTPYYNAARHVTAADKFLQKWGSLLRERERERVLLRVKEVSQAVNIIYAALK